MNQNNLPCGLANVTKRLWKADKKHISRTNDVGFHYETYGEISPSRTLPYAQFDFAVSDGYSLEKIHTASLVPGEMGWSQHKSPPYHGVTSRSHLPNDAVCILIYILATRLFNGHILYVEHVESMLF